MPNFWWSLWTSVKVNQKIISILLIFLLKSTPSWLTSAKLHHWGHTKLHEQLGIEIVSVACNLWQFCPDAVVSAVRPKQKTKKEKVVA
jgi:hypothetical protein